MTVMLLGRLVTRPLRAVATRYTDTGQRPRRRGRRVSYDPFFADPAVVEDDSRRMAVRNAERLALEAIRRPGRAAR